MDSICGNESISATFDTIVDLPNLKCCVFFKFIFFFSEKEELAGVAQWKARGKVIPLL